jgi:pimeloyl-ACP methyl ester carboxylesterase
MTEHTASPFIRTHFLSLDGQRIAVHESAGAGPAVVLVHGNSSSSRVWQRSFAGELGRTHRLVAIDLPGHGQSDDAAPERRAATYSVPGYAQVIRRVVAELGLERAVFVGWSLGGHAVLEASPELAQAAGFVIFGTPPLPFPLPASLDGAFLRLGLGFMPDWTEAQAREYVADFMATGVAPPASFLEDALRTDGQARGALGASLATVGGRDEVRIVRDLARPLAILHGAQEQIVGLPYLQSLAPAMPTLWQGQVQVVEGAGHALQWERTQEFDRLIASFAQHCGA